MSWEREVQEKFEGIIGKVPPFLREMAKTRVTQKAEGLARAEGRGEVTEKDMVDAFFAETPFGFHRPLKADMESLGVDYQKYGH